MNNNNPNITTHHSANYSIPDNCYRMLATIIIPSYNHERYIKQTIQSVFNQTYHHIELIVIDDGSNDRSPEIISEMLTASPIPMLYIRKRNEGVCKTLNVGMKAARGQFLSFLASDDMICPNKIELQVNYLLKTDDEVGGCFGDIEPIDIEGKTEVSYIPDTCALKEASFLSMILFKGGSLIQATCIKSAVFKQIGLFDETLRCEDWDIMLRILREYKLDYVPGAVCLRRNVPGSLGSRFVEYEGDFFKILSKHKDYPDAIRFGFNKIKANLLLMLSQWAFNNTDTTNSRKYAFKAFMCYPLYQNIYYFIAKSVLPHKLILFIRILKKNLT